MSADPTPSPEHAETLGRIAAELRRDPRALEPEPEERAPAPRGRINVYTCPAGHETVTVDRVEGVTPFMLKCRGAEGCEEMARSAMYQVDQDREPAFEFYRPSRKELRRHDRETREYVGKGALLLRPIRPASGYVSTHTGQPIHPDALPPALKGARRLVRLERRASKIARNAAEATPEKAARLAQERRHADERKERARTSRRSIEKKTRKAQRGRKKK